MRLKHPNIAKLHIFQTPNGKSKNWYCGLFWKGRALRKSTGTTDLKEAYRIAEDWYEDRRYEIKHGILKPPAAHRFSSFVSGALARHEPSPAYHKSLSIYLAEGGPIMSFFGQQPVKELSSSTWDDFRTFVRAKRAAAGKPAWSEGSFHQHKNAVKLVLKEAQLQKAITQVPRFTDLMKHKKKLTQPRIYFDSEEYRALIKASQANIRNHKRLKTRWVADAEELHDYIIFMVNAGLRVGESRQMLVSDVKVVTQPDGEEICKLTIKAGKRGPGVAVSFTGAPRAFKRILERREISDAVNCSEPLFLKHHRDAFRNLLVQAGLRHDGLGNKRDFVSLRHTYICFGLERGVPIQDIAKNTRTSVSMIEKHYAALLPPNASALNKKHWASPAGTPALSQALEHPLLRADNDGAPGPTRTGTLLPTRDFKSRASTNSATGAVGFDTSKR